MSKILQARLQQYVNVQAGFRKGRGTRDQIVEETQAGIKIAGRYINNLRYAEDTTLMAESEEELKSLLMTVKGESEKAGLNSTFKKRRSWHPVPSFYGK